ncbi:MAG: hypothetical protein HOP29_15910 [Phycisphaerales bacterium]|nr:hypothetical protein [Phycisphaerales bacterium]
MTQSVIIESQPIHVGAWSGRVLTRYASPVCRLPSPIQHVPIDAWRNWLEALVNARVAGRKGTVLKHSRDGQVFRTAITLNDRTINVICKYEAPRGLRERLRPARAPRNWSRTVALMESGVPTALPLAYLIGGRFRAPSWFVAEALPDVVDLERVANGLLWEIPPERVASIKRALIGELARLCNQLRAGGWGHRDFKASNILVTDWNDPNVTPRMWLVDLDGLTRRPLARFGLFGRDSMERAVVRLAASLGDVRSITRTDRLRFLNEQRPIIGDWKAYWHFVSRTAADYNRRGRRRKRGKLDGFDVF